MNENLNTVEKVAAKLGYDIPTVLAVAEVESSGKGFLSDGSLKVLFEGHIFYKYTNGAFYKSHPTLCYPKWTKEHYSKGSTVLERGKGELIRLKNASLLDENAAYMSASYGKFQIMGFNHEVCGFQTAEDMFDYMAVCEENHLAAFAMFIVGNKLDDELIRHDWEGFARKYNGPSYKVNNYHTKLKEAWIKYSKQ